MGKRESLQADSRGRVSLGAAYANSTFLIEKKDDCIIIRTAKVVPEREAWLYKNKKALAMVRKGIEQARKRQFGKGISLDEENRIAATMPDE